MRKYFIIILASIISLSTYSQDFESGDINKKSYVRVGLSTPTWNCYGYKDKNDMKQNADVEGRIGAMFELGTIFPLNSINVGRNMRFGINVDWLTVRALVFNLQGSENLYNAFVASKIGPSFTYAPAKAIAIDVYGKFNMNWASGIYYNHQDADGNIDIYRGFFQPTFSTGFNVKLAIIMLGFEYDFGKVKVKNSEDDYFGNAVNTDNKTPLNSFSVTFGFTF